MDTVAVYHAATGPFRALTPQSYTLQKFALNHNDMVVSMRVTFISGLMCGSMVTVRSYSQQDLVIKGYRQILLQQKDLILRYSQLLRDVTRNCIISGNILCSCVGLCSHARTIVLSRLQLEPYYDHESSNRCSGESVGYGHLLEISVTVIMVWLHGCIMARSQQVIEGGTAESPVLEVKDAEKSFISGTSYLVHSIYKE